MEKKDLNRKISNLEGILNEPRANCYGNNRNRIEEEEGIFKILIPLYEELNREQD